MSRQADFDAAIADLRSEAGALRDRADDLDMEIEELEARHRRQNVKVPGEPAISVGRAPEHRCCNCNAAAYVLVTVAGDPFPLCDYHAKEHARKTLEALG